jgi:hypothetical protein
MFARGDEQGIIGCSSSSMIMIAVKWGCNYKRERTLVKREISFGRGCRGYIICSHVLALVVVCSRLCVWHAAIHQGEKELDSALYQRAYRQYLTS